MSTVARSLPTTRWLSLPLFAAVFVVCVATALGLWQLRRAQAKLDLHQAQSAQAQAAPLAQEALLALVAGAVPPAPAQSQKQAPLAADWLFRKAQLRGHWLPEHTVYLDNRQMQGRVGFHVLTPLQLDVQPDPVKPDAARGRAGVQAPVILVERGWVARDFQDRTKLPAVPAAQGPRQVLVRLLAQPSALYALGAADQRGEKIRQNVDVAALAQELGLSLLPLSAQELERGQNDGLGRDWVAPSPDVDKHYGYAFQWFALAALAAILGLMWLRRQPKKFESERISV